MARKVQQIRYYSENDKARNQPSTLKMNRLVSGAAFSGYYPILQLGIQSLPGVKFYLNNSTTPIIIGYTGIYDLELDGITEITHLRFDAESTNLINKDNSSYLIVDFIYDDGEGE